ncbi:MAG: NACHT domain-containing protein, partial [Frankia sp.]
SVGGERRALTGADDRVDDPGDRYPGDRDLANRRVMLTRVRRSLADPRVAPAALSGLDIVLRLRSRPDLLATAGGLGSDLGGSEFLSPEPVRLAAGTRVVDVFLRHGESLLLLGGPGAGKTTLAWETVARLAETAEDDPRAPIPVPVNLSSWCAPRSGGKGTLAAWLVEQLLETFDVPRPLGRRWLADGVILPVLDGLDEAADDQRADCVLAINRMRWRRGYGLPVIVCCRTEDYERLPERLRVRTVLEVEVLDPEEVQDRLAAAGPAVAGLRAAAAADPELADLLRTPLLLDLAAHVYQGVPSGAPDRAEIARPRAAVRPPAAARARLIDEYVERALDHRTGARGTREEEERWLRWLAAGMARSHRAELRLHGMQPSWLRGRWRPAISIVSAAAVSFVCTVAAVGAYLLLWVLPGTPPDGLTSGVALLAVGATSLVLFGWLGFGTRIKHAERFAWSWPAARQAPRSQFVGGFFLGHVLGALIGILTLNPLAGLLGAVSCTAISWELIAMSRGLTVTSVLQDAAWPMCANLHRLAFNAMAVGAAAALAIAVPGGVAVGALSGVTDGLWAFAIIAIVGVVVLSMVSGLQGGGRACMQHWTLRLALAASGDGPRHLSAFLERAAELSLLRRVGGGYTFRHSLVRDPLIPDQRDALPTASANPPGWSGAGRRAAGGGPRPRSSAR